MKETKPWFVKVWTWEADEEYLMVVTDLWEKILNYVYKKYGPLSICSHYGDGPHPKQNYKSVIIT